MNGNVQQSHQRMATVARPATRRRRRRSTVPVMLACIAGIVAARDMLFPAGAPKGAMASSIVASVLPRPGEVTALRAPTQRTATSLSPLQQWLAQPLEPVSRNLFCPSGKSPATLSHVGDNGQSTRNAPSGAALAANSARLPQSEQKSVDGHADGQGRRDTVSQAPAQGAQEAKESSKPVRIEDRQQQQKQQARQIRLQSTLASSAKPSALVNGRLVREGDVVAVGAGSTRAEYRVLKIEARRILLEREGIELEVTMD